MKIITLIGVCLGCCVSAQAQKTVAEYDWKNAVETAPKVPGVTRALEGKALRITSDSPAPATVRLLTITHPPITTVMYRITGRVKYANVQGDGYLELWNCFAGLPQASEQRYFSRTIVESGEMGKLTGSSDWRVYSLPFNSRGAPGAPTKLEINLVLPGKGVVYLEPIKLQEFSGARGWWSGQTTNLVGGIGGGVVGCLGGLAAWLAAKGKARGFVLGIYRFFFGLGVVCSIMLAVALVAGQPLEVWLIFLLGGAILATVGPTNLRRARKQYEELEMRRMTSVDAL